MPAASPNDSPRDIQFVQDAFWIIIGRAVMPSELHDTVRSFDAHERRMLLMRLLTSLQFENVRTCWEQRDPQERAAHEQGLKSVGSDEAFVMRAYECLLGRPADAGGLAHYTAA